MKSLLNLTKRNTKLFFKDKGMFFTSLITPIILLVLYVTFLASVYKSSISSSFIEGVAISEALINGCVGSQLFSSLLAVSCITVSFCANMIMVQDKVTGARFDLTITPVKSWKMSLSYYISTVIVSLIVCYCAMLACFIYLSVVGWYMSFGEVLLVILDVFLLVLFGTALSSVINFFLNSQGQISAVGTIVSAGYGFICGAYMPISSFAGGLQKVLMFLPGTYGTALIRNHSMNGTFEAMLSEGAPSEMINALKDNIDFNFYFFGDKVSIGAMYLVLTISIAVLISVYVLLNVLKKKETK